MDYFMISDYRKGVGNDGLFSGLGIVRNTANKTVRTYILNAAIFNAFIGLTNRSSLTDSLIKPSKLIDPNQVMWKVGNKNKYQYIDKRSSGYISEWISKYSFCFESLHKDTGQSDSKICQETMLELNQLLGLQVHWKRLLQNVFVLTKIDIDRSNETFVSSLTSSELVTALNQNPNHPYVFDESGGNIILPKSLAYFKNAELMNKVIRKYGLEFQLKTRKVDKLIFME